jgi:enamine deaminase RidA (YjgF/YER057c/UK114 family)
MDDILRFENGPRLSRVVVHGNTVYLFGHVSRDRDADIRTQTRQVLERMDESLAMAGSHKSRLLSVTVWLADVSDYGPMNEVWDAWVDPDNAPVRSTVGATLISPGRKVVMNGIAAR